MLVSSVEFVRATRARFVHQLLSEGVLPKVINRVACHDVLPGDARTFEAFSVQSWIFSSCEFGAFSALALQSRGSPTAGRRPQGEYL